MSGSGQSLRAVLAAACFGGCVLSALGCTVGGMAIGSAIDRSAYDEVDPRGSAGDRGSIVRITTIEGRLVEGVYETEVYRDDQRALVLNRGDRGGGLFPNSARRDTVRVDEIAQLETQGKPGRYRDLFAVSGALVDAAVIAYILGGLVQLGD